MGKFKAGVTRKTVNSVSDTKIGLNLFVMQIKTRSTMQLNALDEKKWLDKKNKIK